jgi:transposase
MEHDSADPRDWREWREWRRRRALALQQQGWKQRAIATALAVSEAAVSQWLSAARRAGPSALRAHPPPGGPPRLSAQQRDTIPELLWHGAEAYGFRGDVWTCARVAQVIKEEFGVAYSKSHVSRLLLALDWTPQKPITRARQRDEAAIAHWRSVVWPRLRDAAQQEGRTLVFVDEAGFYLLPGVVKTYSPRGQTPVLTAWVTRDHLSVMGALTPAGQLYTLVRATALNGLHTIKFLCHLQRQAGARLLVIWDGSPIHRRRALTDFLASPAGWGIRVEALPGYAPDLNPWDAAGWHQLKDVELPNQGWADLAELHEQLHLALGRLRQKPALIQQFFHAAGLTL